MAINYSSNKVRVSKLLGTDAVIGYMDPVVGMRTQFGVITGLDSGNFQVTVGMGRGAPTGVGPMPQKFYPHDLRIDYEQATGDPYLFPTSDGSRLFGHFGNDGMQPDPASGQHYLGGDGVVHTFTRPPQFPH